MPVQITTADIKQRFPSKVFLQPVYEIKKYLKDDMVTFDQLVKSASFCIAGGFLRSLIEKEDIKDIDIYPKTLADYMKIIEIMLKYGWKEHVSSTCITYTKKGKTIQLMKKWRGEPREIISKFDFTICMAAWQPGTGIYWFYKHFQRDIENKDLIFNTNAMYPIRSINRSYKYIDYGYWLKTMDLLAIVMKIWYLNLEDDDSLRDQIFFYTENESEIFAQVVSLRHQCRPKMTLEKMAFMQKHGFVEQIDNVTKHTCPFCGADIIKHNFRDRKSLKEFAISGMCQKCQDDFFDPD